MLIVNTIRDLWRISRDPTYKEAIAAGEGHVDETYDCGGSIRFSSRCVNFTNRVGGDLETHVLMYAIPRSDGMFEIGTTDAKSYDKHKDSGLRYGILDHVPLEGEHVIGWIRGEDTRTVESHLMIDRARSYLEEHHLGGFTVGFVWPVDSPYYAAPDPAKEAILPMDGKIRYNPGLVGNVGTFMVVCDLAHDCVVELPGGGIAARVPFDLVASCIAYVSISFSELDDDPWHKGRKALFLRNTANREWREELDGDVSCMDSSELACHVKLAQQLGRRT